MRVSADRESCISAGRCMAATSEVFDQDEDGIVTLLVEEPEEADADGVRAAGDLCPSGSITVHED